MYVGAYRPTLQKATLVIYNAILLKSNIGKYQLTNTRKDLRDYLYTHVFDAFY